MHTCMDWAIHVHQSAMYDIYGCGIRIYWLYAYSWAAAVRAPIRLYRRACTAADIAVYESIFVLEKLPWGPFWGLGCCA